jgi:multidrug resistance protein, MATE family
MNPQPAASLGARFGRDARAILRLGLPLLVNNLSVAGMGFADTVMGGRLGSGALAAIAVGVSYYGVFMILAIGFMMALSPLAAHAYGRGDYLRVGEYLRQGGWLGGALATLLVLGLAAARPALALIGTDPAILADAVGYVHAMAFGIPALVGFQALRFASEGVGRTKPMMYIAVLGLATNVCGNWVFMYGKLGMPALGAVGTGVATAIVSWVMFIAMLAHAARHRAYRPYRLFARFEPPQPQRLAEILALSLPISGSLVAEGGLFSAAGLMIGTLGATMVAAHQIALNYASFMFMAPLALHSATTIHVGHALGRGDRPAGRFAGFVGIALCGALMLLSAVLIAVGNGPIAQLYTRDPAVTKLAASLLLLAGAFQVSDGLQVGAAGALRGFKDARVPLLICIGSYWLVGFPLAFGLGVVRGGGPAGVWYGLIAGLSVCALALNLRFLTLSAGGESRPAAPARL